MKAPQLLIALVAGCLFGLGLALSGMTDTRVVLGFLDIAGNWNPALIFVMGGALAVTVPGFWWARRRAHPIAATQFPLQLDVEDLANPDSYLSDRVVAAYQDQ